MVGFRGKIIEARFEPVTAELVKPREAGQNELYKGAMNLGQIMTNSAGGIQLDPAGPYNPPYYHLMSYHHH